MNEKLIDRSIDTDKKMSQAFVEQLELALAPIIIRIKNRSNDPAELNHLRMLVRVDSAHAMKSVIDNLNKKFPTFSIDPEKLGEALRRLLSTKEESADDIEAWLFLMESNMESFL
jgi:hypothetical protein